MHPHAGLARRIGRLAARIAAVEHADRRRESARPVPTGWEAVDRLLTAGEATSTTHPGGIITGAVHEWYGVEGRHEGTRARRHEGKADVPSARLAATQAQRGERERGKRDEVNRQSSIVNRQSFSPPLSILIHLALQALAQRESHALHVIWIGSRCWPYVRAILRDGGRDHQLLARSIFIDADSIDERLWSIDLAARCPAIAAVIADGSGFDMAATRRLQLAAQMNDALVLLARPAHELDQLSAATTRWIVSPSREDQENHRDTESTEEEEVHRKFSETPHLRSAAPKMRIERHVTLDSGSSPLAKPLRTSVPPCLRALLLERAPLTSFGSRLNGRAKRPLSPLSLCPSIPQSLSFSPRWTVQLLRCKGVQPMTREARAQLPLSFALEMDRETGNLVIPADVADRSRPAKTSARRSA